MNAGPSSPSVLEDSIINDQLSPATRSISGRSGISELVACITHDFNNILHVIQAHTDLILSHSIAGSELCEYAAVIRDTVDEGIVLVRQLTGEAEAEPRSEAADINELVRRTMKSLAPVFPPNIAVALELDPRTPPVQCDAGFMYQVFLNLCMNAREAMPEGGSILVRTGTASGASLRERFPGATAEEYIAVAVVDTGIGMQAAVLKRIFELHFTSKKSGQTSGVGLSIVQRAVNRHRGFIDVTSEPGRGSTFEIYLPAPGEKIGTKATPAESDAENRAPGHEKILYAEDDERLLGLMQRFLERQGLTVLTARDGLQAVDVYSRHRDEIAAAVLDSHLPKLDGWEAFRRMRTINPQLKGILASGFVSAEAESRVARGELSGVLQKPYFGAELLAVIKQVIRSQ